MNKFERVLNHRANRDEEWSYIKSGADIHCFLGDIVAYQSDMSLYDGHENNGWEQDRKPGIYFGFIGEPRQEWRSPDAIRGFDGSSIYIVRNADSGDYQVQKIDDERLSHFGVYKGKFLRMRTATLDEIVAIAKAVADGEAEIEHGPFLKKVLGVVAFEYMKKGEGSPVRDMCDEITRKNKPPHAAIAQFFATCDFT